MWQNFCLKIFNTVTGGAVLIALFSIVSKILGLIRDRFLASYFGAGDILDSYYAAFRLPDLVFNTLVLGALASAFIPIFTRLWFKDKNEAWQLANLVLNYLTALLAAISVLVWIFAQPLITMMTPGFSAEKISQTVILTRVMMLSIIFFASSNVVGSMLNSLKRFFSFALAPVFYNLGLILGITVLYPLMGFIGLAWGVVLGSVLHLLIQLPEVLRAGWRYRWIFKITPELKRVFKLMIPRTIGLAGNQINQIVITMIASTLMVGSVAIFNLANNLQSFPISVFGVSLAIAAFPVFSEAFSTGKKENFISAFSLHCRRIIFLIVPTSVFILMLRAQIVRIVLGTGNFDWSDTYYTAQTLGWFVLSLFAQSLAPLIARSFYAFEDTKTPMFIGLLTMALNIALSFFLGAKMGVQGLALAFSLAAIFNAIALVVILRIKLGYLDERKIIWSTFKISINAVVAAAGIYYMLRVMADLVDMQTFWGIFTQGATAVLAGTGVYLAASLLTNCEEIIIVKRFYNRYIKSLFREQD